MERITAKLRYFPLDPVAGPPLPISDKNLETISGNTGANISLQTIVARNRTIANAVIREETMENTLEEISQDVITVSANDERSFRLAVRAVLKLYRAPRTVFGTWGSSDLGNQIVQELCDDDDGWQ